MEFRNHQSQCGIEFSYLICRGLAHYFHEYWFCVFLLLTHCLWLRKLWKTIPSFPYPWTFVSAYSSWKYCRVLWCKLVPVFHLHKLWIRSASKMNLCFWSTESECGRLALIWYRWCQQSPQIHACGISLCCFGLFPTRIQFRGPCTGHGSQYLHQMYLLKYRSPHLLLRQL